MPVKHKPFSELPHEAIAKFWTCFVVGDPNECWIWNGRINTNGYGQIGITVDGIRTFWIASRVAYYVGKGIDPLDLQACHVCDVRRCVNWNHLFLGTNKDNADDCSRKGRYSTLPKCPPEKHAKGERVGTSILTESVVRQIRSLHNSGTSYIELSKNFAVTYGCIYSIVKHINWKHVL